METGKNGSAEAESNTHQVTPDADHRAGSWNVESRRLTWKSQGRHRLYLHLRKKIFLPAAVAEAAASPPLLIPDDVPTGLNGDDHYTYIVGYPNGNAEPKNGITR